MTVRWVVGSWGEACGPRPSGGGDAGGVVVIEERGAELVIAGQGGSYATDQCYQSGPGLSRQSHTAASGAWKTTCRTAPNDARQGLLQTSLTLSGGVLSLQESAQYQFTVRGQTCAASSGRWRTYRRLAAEPPPVVRPCATPGAPARLEVRPSRKLMRPGESFHFRASVLDAQGCSVGAPVAWSVTPQGPVARIDGGQLTLASDAADTQLQVTATAAGQSVKVQVDVVSDDRYAALLATGKFNADGTAVEMITSGSLGTGAAPENVERSDRKWTFVGLVSGIALLFALIGAWLLGRAHRNAAKARAKRRRPPPMGSGTAVYPGDDVVAQPRRRMLDATRLEHSQPVPAAKPATVCPVCGTMYETRGARICPKDGAQLLPINA